MLTAYYLQPTINQIAKERTLGGLTSESKAHACACELDQYT